MPCEKIKNVIVQKYLKIIPSMVFERILVNEQIFWITNFNHSILSNHTYSRHAKRKIMSNTVHFTWNFREVAILILESVWEFVITGFFSFVMTGFSVMMLICYEPLGLDPNSSWLYIVKIIFYIIVWSWLYKWWVEFKLLWNFTHVTAVRCFV